MTLDEFLPERARLRATGKTVVLTNGVFDLLHVGHTRYLAAARAQGDVLVVGVNSDESVRRLKGPTRPLNRAADRAELVAALAAVDVAIIFAEDTAVALAEAIRPDVYVKGAEYRDRPLPERAAVEAAGGRVELVGMVPDRSTTSLVERLREGTPDS